MSIPYLYWILILTSLIVSPASIGIFISFGGVSSSSVASPEIVLGAQSFTSMMTDFSQDINRGFYLSVVFIEYFLQEIALLKTLAVLQPK